MADLLLELFSEEIPARMQAGACEQLSGALKKALDEARLTNSGIETYVTPRRLALKVSGLPGAQPDLSTERKGPKVDAPEAAIQGFLKSTGLSLDQLEKRDGVYFASIHQKGQPAKDALKPILEKILNDFTWPKSMRWGAHEKAWVRPLHSIICLLDSEIIPVQFGNITASNFTFGHRFLSPAKITLSTPADYLAALEKAHVIADVAKRRELVRSKADDVAKSKNLKVAWDEGLLDEVTGLVEWPVPLMGSIDHAFMDQPPEVIITEMKAHQRYFALTDASGKLAPHFIATANMVTSDGGKAVVHGNERVLRARLSDGKFFWDQDRNKKLSDWAKGLQHVIFHAKLGSVAEKVSRIASLADALCTSIPKADKAQVKRAAELCKADLTTGMVGEFPELQGIMGRYYALQQKEAAEVADAIRDHYLPLGPSAPVPTAPTSIAVALADKLDTLAGMFAVGEKPTGSKDPFALRRAALGIIRIVLENNLRLPLCEIFARALAPFKADAKISQELLDFFSDRLKVMLKDQGLRHDYISAVMGGDDDLLRIVARARALDGFLKTDAGQKLLGAYRRASNIVGIEEKKDKLTYSGDVDAKALSQAEEKALFEKLGAVIPQALADIQKDDPTAAMRKLADLGGPVDAFFDKVTVNADDKGLRTNRLKLLSYIRSTLGQIANFSLIEG